MADEPVSFFQEDNGNYSSMRLMNCASLVASVLFGYLTISKPDVGGNGLYITFGFLLGAFAPKVLQKFVEERVPKAREDRPAP